MIALALIACGPPELPEGQQTARYTLLSWEGEVVGQVSLGQAGEARVEHARAALSDLGDFALDLRAGEEDLSDLRAVVRIRDHWERWEIVPASEGLGWISQRGLERWGGDLLQPPLALVATWAPSRLPGVESSLLAWAPVLDDPADRTVSGLDPRTGRALPLRLETRARAVLALDGKPVAARRVFAWTAASGHTAWVAEADSRVLALDGLVGETEAVLDGLALPVEVEPALPAGIVETPEQVSRDGQTLRGLRDAPAGQPRGTVLLIHGSGPGDRHGNYGPVQPWLFRDLAWVLAARGWEVLRYDKRRVATLDDLIADAAAWQELGRGPCQVLMGHSEGTYVAAERALADDRVDGVVFLAGPARRLDQVMAAQAWRVLGAQGAEPDELDALARRQRATMRALSLGRERDPLLAGLPDESLVWLRSHLRHDQGAVLSRLRTPALALFGAEDQQVPPDEEAVEMRRIFDASGHPDATVTVLPGIDHLLMRAQAPVGLGAYRDPDRRLDPAVTNAVLDWLEARPCND